MGRLRTTSRLRSTGSCGAPRHGDATPYRTPVAASLPRSSRALQLGAKFARRFEWSSCASRPERYLSCFSAASHTRRPSKLRRGAARPAGRPGNSPPARWRGPGARTKRFPLFGITARSGAREWKVQYPSGPRVGAGENGASCTSSMPRAHPARALFHSAARIAGVHWRLIGRARRAPADGW
jgi:hypothetical protein